MSRSERTERAIRSLTALERATLTVGDGMWSTAAVPRLGVPAIRMTDGPGGARGDWSPAMPSSDPNAISLSVPCGTALGATWNRELVREVARVVADDARAKGCRLLLAPNLNLQRSPLGGRNFESFSEEPFLAGMLGIAFSEGVRSRGVGAVPKHFVCNDFETERNTTSVDIDERTLREISLVPFELVLRSQAPVGVMVAYNRVNGVHVSEDPSLLRSIVRDEWGFEGPAITDWWAIGSVPASVETGVDLQMPGPDRFYGAPLVDAVDRGEIGADRLDEMVGRILGVLDALDAWDDDADDRATEPRDPAAEELLRRAAAASMVLLENDGVLPLDPTALRSLAVIGPNADRAVIMGGGSAMVNPCHRTSPADAIRQRFAHGGPAVVSAVGCELDVAGEAIAFVDDGDAGILVEFFASEDRSGPVVHRERADASRLIFLGEGRPGLAADSFSLRATGSFVAATTGTHVFTFTTSGRAAVMLDDAVLFESSDHSEPGTTELFGMGTRLEERGVHLDAGTTYRLVIEYSTVGGSMVKGVEVCWRKPPATDPVDDAVRLAQEADAVILVVGTDENSESEGFDRSSWQLPGRQVELIDRVCAANPRTVVVLNSGSIVDLEWAGRVPALLVSWFGGQEMATALADVVFGDRSPGGRLPMTVPMRIEHAPSFSPISPSRTRVAYHESVLWGTRWYSARDIAPRYPLGHGLSYTQFEVVDGSLELDVDDRGVPRVASVEVCNTGDVSGSTVLQCYVDPPAGSATAGRRLAGFEAAEIAAGHRRRVHIEIDDRAFMRWEPVETGWSDVARRAAGALPAPLPTRRRPERSAWTIEDGRYLVAIGRSALDIVAQVEVSLSNVVDVEARS